MAISQTFLGYLSSAADASSYSLGSVSPASGGLLVVVVGTPTVTQFRSVSAVTVGGSGATLVRSSGNSFNTMAIAALEVVAGTYAIDVAMSGVTQRCGVACYLLTGYASATPVDTDFITSGSTNTERTLSLDYPTGGGLGIYGVVKTNSGVVGWSSAVEDVDAAVESSYRAAAAHRSDAGVGVTETASWTSTYSTMIGAVWEPAAAPTGRLKRVGYNGGFATPYNGGLAG